MAGSGLQNTMHNLAACLDELYQSIAAWVLSLLAGTARPALSWDWCGDCAWLGGACAQVQRHGIRQHFSVGVRPAHCGARGAEVASHHAGAGAAVAG